MGFGLAVFTHGRQGGNAVKFVKGRKRNCLERRPESARRRQLFGRGGEDDIEVLRLDGTS